MHITFQSINVDQIPTDETCGVCDAKPTPNTKTWMAHSNPLKPSNQTCYIHKLCLKKFSLEGNDRCNKCQMPLSQRLTFNQRMGASVFYSRSIFAASTGVMLGLCGGLGSLLLQPKSAISKDLRIIINLNAATGAFIATRLLNLGSLKFKINKADELLVIAAVAIAIFTTEHFVAGKILEMAAVELMSSIKVPVQTAVISSSVACGATFIITKAIERICNRYLFDN